jgi:archaellum biogenesis ATPase FlaH
MNNHYLGYLAAESYEEKEKFLKKAFVTTKAIERSLGGNVCFICGRKGAGKTAIASKLQYLLDHNGDIIYQSIAIIKAKDYDCLHISLFNSLATITMNNYQDSSEQLEEIYYCIWLYIIELTAMKTAIEIPCLKEKNQYSESILVIEEYLNQISAIEYPICDNVANKAVDLLSEVNKSEPETLLTKLHLKIRNLRNIPLHRKAIDSLKIILSEYSIAVTIDTMEKYDLSDHRVFPFRGMCKAVKEIQLERNINNLQVKCFLPAEMTEDLFSENLAKYNEFSEYLLWTSSELMEFIARRFAILMADLDKKELAQNVEYVLNNKIDLPVLNKDIPYKNVLFDDFWNKFFPETIENKFKWPEKSFNYLLRHTQKRPREIMSCLNSIISYAIQNNEFIDGKVSCESFKDGIHDEDNIYQLLSDNLAVFNLPKTELTLSEVTSNILANEYTIFSGAYFSRFSRRALSILSTEDILDKVGYSKKIILRSGLLGVVKPHSDLSPAYIWNDTTTNILCKYYFTEFEYLIPGHVVVSENSLCAVHPILSDRLHLNPPVGDIGVVYPIPEKNDDLIKIKQDYK